MKILFMGNNWLGWQILSWLHTAGEEIAGLVLHPDRRQKYGREIRESVSLPPERIFDGSRLREPATLEAIEALNPEIGISALFGYIVPPDLLDLMPAGCLNIHPAFLPYNRGAFPDAWSIIDGTPAGVTLHYMDSGLDTGEIVAQREVVKEPVDTGASLYRKLERESLSLFKETWPLIRSGAADRTPQRIDDGTFHRVCDVEGVDEIDLDRSYGARELIDLIRARTFPPFKGAYFRHGTGKVYLRLQLSYEEDLI